MDSPVLNKKSSGAITGAKLYESRLIPAEQVLLQFSLIRNTQLPAAFCAAACQHFTAIGCLHTFAKTMNGFTTAAMRLKCTFHCLLFFHVSPANGRIEIQTGEAVLVSGPNRSPHPLFVKGRQR
jgi:hypothetical protein